MCSLQELNDKATLTAFEKKLVSATQHLHSYIKHRLYIAESTGIIPKNMYTSSDLIDEGIVAFYENGYDIDMDAMAIKLKLFKIVDNKLDTLFKKEAFHKETISTNSILEEELDDLEEHFSMDADLDYIMNEELNDISYKQENKHKHLFIYNDKNVSILNAFEIQETPSIYNKNLLGKFYTWLPIKISDIVDLFIFGRLNYQEIAKIKNIEVNRVERILTLAIKSFRKHLD